MLAINAPFPAFSLPDQDGKTHTLAEFSGRWLVVYFYPKDDTPGCTLQGKAFTERKAEYEKLGATVVGVSADDVASHKNFCNKFSFSHMLLSDTNEQLLKACGLTQSEWKGTQYWERATVLVNPQGNVAKVYRNVTPQGHDQALLDDLRALQGKA